MSHFPHQQQAPPPLYSPTAYAQVPSVPAVVPTAPPAPPRNAAPATAPEYGHALGPGPGLGGAGVDLGASFPPTPYTPYAYHGQQASPQPVSHAPLQPAIPTPIPMPEPQRPARAPPLPHRRHEPLLHPAPHASVLSPPMTATTQLLMPSPPSTNTNIVPSHLFEEPVASSQGSASYLVERVPIDDAGHTHVTDLNTFERRRRALVPTGRSPPSSSSSIPFAASAPSSASISLTRPPASAAIVPQPSPPSSLSRPTLPDWAKDPDDDRPPIRPPVYLTLPFVLKLLLILISLSGIATIRTIIPAYVAATTSDEREAPSPTFLLAYQWLLVVSLAYALAHVVSFSSCFYNRHARKVSVSPQRQAWKLRVRRFVLLPVEVAMTLAWLTLTLLIGLVQDEWALYVTVCSIDPAGSGLVGARVGVSCTQATAMLVVAGMMASACGLAVGQLGWATWKNQRKVSEFKTVVVDDGEPGTV